MTTKEETSATPEPMPGPAALQLSPGSIRATQTRTLGWPSMGRPLETDTHTIVLKWRPAATVEHVKIEIGNTAGKRAMFGMADAERWRVHDDYESPGRDLIDAAVRAAHRVLSECEAPAVVWVAP